MKDLREAIMKACYEDCVDDAGDLADLLLPLIAEHTQRAVEAEREAVRTVLAGSDVVRILSRPDASFSVQRKCDALLALVEATLRARAGSGG